MFRKKGHKIESDKGFSIERVGVTKIIYKEGDRSVTVYCERLTGPVSFYVWLGYPEYWEPPFENEKITQSEWKKIAKNMLEGFRFRGIEIQLQFMTPREIDSSKRLHESLEEWKKGKPPVFKTFDEWKRENGLK